MAKKKFSQDNRFYSRECFSIYDIQKKAYFIGAEIWNGSFLPILP
ncbi:MAG: hypothetical protein Q8Q55_00015 [Undibacterium sp.]|nr:hypothetical protein [Undibacterium sp.]